MIGASSTANILKCNALRGIETVSPYEVANSASCRLHNQHSRLPAL